MAAEITIARERRVDTDNAVRNILRRVDRLRGINTERYPSFNDENYFQKVENYGRNMNRIMRAGMNMLERETGLSGNQLRDYLRNLNR